GGRLWRAGDTWTAAGDVACRFRLQPEARRFAEGVQLSRPAASIRGAAFPPASEGAGRCHAVAMDCRSGGRAGNDGGSGVLTEPGGVRAVSAAEQTHRSKAMATQSLHDLL